MKLGIIGEMAIEIADLKEKMADMVTHTRTGMEFYEGTLEGIAVVVVQCGVGKVNAAMCTQVLCDVFQVTHVINTGVAGSLCAELDIGDLVISEDAMYHDFDCHVINPNYRVGQVPGMSVLAYPADPALMTAALASAEEQNPGHNRIGRIASGDQFICNKEQKSYIITHTGALCTEMEGAAIAHTAWRNGVPFVVIRAISDKADDSAEMDYPTFELIAAHRCSAVTIGLMKQLVKGA